MLPYSIIVNKHVVAAGVASTADALVNARNAAKGLGRSVKLCIGAGDSAWDGIEMVVRYTPPATAKRSKASADESHADGELGHVAAAQAAMTDDSGF